MILSALPLALGFILFNLIPWLTMGKEKLFTLIKSPIITEQTAQLGEKLKQVVFKVDLSANKREIKQK